MHGLCHALQLIIDGLDDRPLSDHDLVICGRRGMLVLSVKLMPVHLPKQYSSRNMAIWTAMRDSNSTKRLYDTALGKESFR